VRGGPNGFSLNANLQKAIELALAGNWTGAHEIVQKSENDPVAAWIHAVLHKIEGDLGNARYWYSRAGKLENLEDEPKSELAKIKSQLMEGK
jgi:hypothetical protein